MTTKSKHDLAAQSVYSGSGWRWYAALFVLATLGTLLLFGYMLYESRALAVAKATADGTNLTRVLERQLDSSLRRMDADLQNVISRLQPEELEFKNAPRYRPQWNRYLNELQINFVEVMGFFIIDANGDALYSTGKFRDLNVADRTHFKRLKEDPNAGLVWSDVVLAKSNNRPTIGFARGLRDRNGKVKGMVVALVDMDYFQKLIAGLDIGPQGLISIRDTLQYKLLLRQPERPGDLNKASKSANFDRILKGDRQGFVLFTSPLDGVARYTTFLVLNDYPFVVTVALGEQDVLAAWQTQALVSSVIASALLVLVGLMLIQLWRAESARRQTMKDLVVARDSAEEASRSKGQFLANMSHEIRTPMNAILGMLNLLQSTELTARQADYASKTEGAAKSLLGLLNDILDYSKVEAGKMTLESEPFSLDHMLRNLAVVLSANVGTKGIEVLYDVDRDLPDVVAGDAMRLQQVLINLGGNAVKFTAQGQVVLRLRKLAASDAHVTIEFAVSDSGIGIAMENQDRVFSGFSQAEASTTRRFGGMGLGLSICKPLVALMGGQLKLQSELGKGSTFSFELQFPMVDQIPPPLIKPLPAPLHPRRTLVVDDNVVAQQVHSAVIAAWGWPVDVAGSGAGALDRVRAELQRTPGEFPYPLILVDWQMPDMDGWKTIRALRLICTQANLAMPTVVMTTSQGRDMLCQISAEDQNMLGGFLAKPITAPMLYEAVMGSDDGSAPVRRLTRDGQGGQRLAGMRILVVEDNLINQQVAEELLSREGAIVSLAANGQLGVDAVKAAAPQFDVVLMDIQMPVLDGYGATRLIREQLKLSALPIIAMTANAMSGDREACLAAGMDEHIGKPFDLRKLVSLLLRMTQLEAEPQKAAGSSDQPAHLPEIPGLKLEVAIGRMAGLRSLYARTARDFVKILATVIQDLTRALDAGDERAAVMLLHTLKGNAGTLGAVALEQEAARLEALCRQPDGFAQCRALLPQFSIEVRDCTALMQEAIAILADNQ